MIPFTPEHKITFEQLSKDLQDRFTQAQTNLKEIEAKVEEARKKINSNPITAESTTKIEKLKIDITEYNRRINNLIDTKVREINNANYTTPVTEYILGTGIDGHWSKIDQQNKKLFGDDAFDVVLVYKNITSQEFTQLKTFTPTSIASKYGLLETRVRAAFDMTLRKVYIYNGTTWTEETNTTKTNEYFSKYLCNRSFYVNPITKSLCFYYEPGNACLIGKGTDEEIGKIVGNINTIDRNKNMDMPLIKPPPPTPPPTPKPTLEKNRRYYPTNTVIRNDRDLEEIGKFLIIPRMHKRPFKIKYAKTLHTMDAGGMIWAIKKHKIENLINTVYDGSVYFSMDKKFLDGAKSCSGEYYIPPITATLYDDRYFTNARKDKNTGYPPTPAKEFLVTYEGLINGQYDAELEKATAYFIYQKDFTGIKFLVNRVNGLIPPRFLIITGSPLKGGGAVVTGDQLRLYTTLPDAFSGYEELHSYGNYDYSAFSLEGLPVLYRIHMNCFMNNTTIEHSNNGKVEIVLKAGEKKFGSIYDEYIQLLSSGGYEGDTASYYYNKKGVFAFDTEFNGNAISVSLMNPTYVSKPEEVDEKNLSTYHFINTQFIVPYISGLGFGGKVGGEFLIQVWTGVDTYK